MVMKHSDTEILEIYDAAGQSLGTMDRREAESLNHLTANVLVFIFTPAGKVWIQLRPQNKAHYPGRWDISACGGITTSEPPEVAAQREQLEEMGFTCPLTFVEVFLNVFPGDSGETRRRLSSIFIGESDIEPQRTDDADEFRAVEPDELLKESAEFPDRFVPSLAVELNKAVAAYRRHKTQSA